MAEQYLKIRKDIASFADAYKDKIENILNKDGCINRAGPYSIRVTIETCFDEIADPDLGEYLRKNQALRNNLSSHREILTRFKV